MNKRIMIIGPGGAGKTELSLRLGEVLHLPIYHLDNIWWKEDKTHIERSEFDLILEEILKQDEWIIDGDYSRTYEVRIKESDTVVFLDYSLEDCLLGIKTRIGTKRSDIPFTEDELDPDLEKQVMERYKINKELILLLKGKYPNKNWIILNNRKEADEWLEKCEELYAIK